MTAAEKLLATARGEIGYLEKKSNSQLDSKTSNAGSGNWTKYAAYLDTLGVYNGKKNGYAWCDVFVDWCLVTTFGVELAMKMTGQPMGGYGAGCTSSANYYKQIGWFHTGTPKPGDQIFFTSADGKSMSHTGLVDKVTGGKVYTIEGNTSGASGVVANGGGVWEKSYSLTYSRIGGYGRPDWNLVKEDDMELENRVKALEGKLQALENSHANLFKDVGTLDSQFNQRAAETVYDTLDELPAYARPTVEKLVEAGILKGDGRMDKNGRPAGLGLSTDMARLMVVLDRAGAFKVVSG